MSTAAPALLGDDKTSVFSASSTSPMTVRPSLATYGFSPLHIALQAVPPRQRQFNIPSDMGIVDLHTTALSHRLPEAKPEPCSDLPGPCRKRRRSRKGLGKRFECTAEGCGKGYSRAEHLHRHQLNHNSKQIFHCEYSDCPRTFVRADLLKRHMDRHAAKGPQLGRRDSVVNQLNQIPDAKSPSPDSNRLDPSLGSSHPPSGQYPAAAENSPGPYFSNLGRASSDAIGSEPPASSTGDSLDDCQATRNIPHRSTIAPVCTMAPGPFTQPSGTTTTYPSPASIGPPPPSVALHLSPAQYANSSSGDVPPRGPGPSRSTDASPAEYPELLNRQSNELIALDQMAMSAAGPVFGDDGGLSKSPCVGVPEDFWAYLFNPLPPTSGSPNSQEVSAPGLNYGDLQSHPYSISYPGNGTALSMGYFTTAPQQIMAVNNLLDQNAPEASISEERSEELFDFIRDRFHENDLPPVERQRDNIVGGDRSMADHVLSRRMMQAYISSYWQHFSDQLPILHKPTFSSETTPNLLLLAMMAIGAACLDRSRGQQLAKAGANVSNFIARHLRWEIFMDWNFRPPAKLWIFQALILLELYEKMYSSRELHERAHIHHATTITLMRRGRSLIGKSSSESPPNAREEVNGPQHPSATAEAWWNDWIANEATRRAAFAAFVVDTTHATMFGHSGVMVAHEMRLPLPCDESLWGARSSAELARAESNLSSQGVKPLSFLEGLKRTLSHQEVPTTSFGRTVLMAGLLSVTYHMHQRDLQVNILGGGVIHPLGGRDKWRATLTRAYDSWKTDFDKGLERCQRASGPYRHKAAKQELTIVFASRTVLHHLAHMAMHADIVDCQMFARAKRLLGRTIGRHEFEGAQRRIKDLWAPSARARDATLYALKFLCSVLVPGADEVPQADGPYANKAYDARYDVLMNRPWVLYFAVLVVWCYGFALEGPCSESAAPGPGRQEVQGQMRDYLLRYWSISDPDDLRSARGINNNTALLMVLQESFENTQWDLLREASNLVRNCIILNAGGTIA